MTTTAVEVQRRYLTINEPKADSDQLEFSFSSETPVTRYFGDEVLDHDREAVDLSRLNGGAAPLLLNHDPIACSASSSGHGLMRIAEAGPASPGPPTTWPGRSGRTFKPE